MADVTLSGSPVISGSLLLPRCGNWTAYLDSIDADTPPEGAVTLRWLGTDLAGYVVPGRSGTDQGRVSAVVVGGAGGLWDERDAKHYTSTAVSRILQEILSDAGESLDPASMPDVLAQVLPSWPRQATDAGRQLDALADAAGAIWRMTADGAIYLGSEEWEDAADFDHTLISEDPVTGSVSFAPEALGVRPGQTWRGQHVGAVQYTIGPGESRARAWFQAEEDTTEDPMKAGLARFVRETMRGVDWMALYPAKVVTQWGDGTVDLQPDSQRLPPPTKVALRVPCHGAKLTVPANARVLLGFDGGDPTKPYAGLWDPSGSGHKAVGRVDDQVNCGSLTVTATAMGTFVWTYTDGLGTTTAGALGQPIPIKGKITTGSPHLSLLPGSTP